MVHGQGVRDKDGVGGDGVGGVGVGGDGVGGDGVGSDGVVSCDVVYRHVVRKGCCLALMLYIDMWLAWVVV